MRRFRYVVVDVFTDTPLAGNQLAVFTDARDLDPVTMQALAKEMNFSETVFVLPPQAEGADVRPLQPASKAMSGFAREAILFTLLLAALMQAMYFQSVFRREGSQRGYAFDVAYKEVFDAAMAMPDRPIYLVDGTSPGYVHAYWYATVEGRNRAELIHMEEGIRPPMGALVIGSEANCANCQVIAQSGEYILYRSLGPLRYQP